MALFEIKISDSSFKLLTPWLEKIVNAITDHAVRTTEGFNKVAEAISDLQILEPLPDDATAVEGTLTMRYIFNEDEVAANPGPKTFTITGSGFKSAAGTLVGAGDIDLSIELTGSNMSASIGNQRLSDDGMEVLADVTIEGNAQQAKTELAVLKYSAKNRDTGNEVAADTDEFETGPGEAGIGQLNTPVPLTEVPETPQVSPVEPAQPAEPPAEPAPAEPPTE